MEQSLVPSNKAIDARVFKLMRPDCDMQDTGKPTCSVILLSLSTDYRQNKLSILMRFSGPELIIFTMTWKVKA